jgi:transposase
MVLKLLGIDTAKHEFYLHGVDGRGKEAYRKKVYRDEFKETLANLKRCHVVLESCGSSNYWAGEIESLRHTVNLIAPQYVKPFVKRNKNDSKDAEAICVAAPQRISEIDFLRHVRRVSGSRRKDYSLREKNSACSKEQ